LGSNGTSVVDAASASVICFNDFAQPVEILEADTDCPYITKGRSVWKTPIPQRYKHLPWFGPINCRF